MSWNDSASLLTDRNSRAGNEIVALGSRPISDVESVSNSDLVPPSSTPPTPQQRNRSIPIDSTRRFSSFFLKQPSPLL